MVFEGYYHSTKGCDSNKGMRALCRQNAFLLTICGIVVIYIYDLIQIIKA